MSPERARPAQRCCDPPQRFAPPPPLHAIFQSFPLSVASQRELVARPPPPAPPPPPRPPAGGPRAPAATLITVASYKLFRRRRLTLARRAPPLDYPSALAIAIAAVQARPEVVERNGELFRLRMKSFYARRQRQ